MCGISLIIDSHLGPGEQTRLTPALAAMQQQQFQRGPDSGGALIRPWGSGYLALGSRRLQILDAGELANQPMERQWQTKKAFLSYNGEVYNYTDLRNELLQQGCSFSTGSDTEVVAFALLVWGKAALQRFSGMFALVYLQEEEGKEPLLLMARDRWGQKPLYYSRQAHHWVVASELQALFASGLRQKKLNQPQLMHYLRYKFAARPQTFFEGVLELEPGQLLQLRPGAQAVPEKYLAAMPVPAPAGTDGQVLERLEDLLINSLITHIQSDKPVGVFLSGGVDSTLMLALLRRHASWQLPVSFTIGSKKPDASWGTQDLQWAEKAAAQYESYHYPLLIEEEEVLGRFKELAQRQDQPIADGAWLMGLLLSQFAASKVKVVLSGAGADELFAGYNRHSAFAAYLKHKKWLLSLLPVLKATGNMLPTARAVPGRQQWQLLKKFSRNLSKDPYQTFLNFTSLSILQQPAERMGPADQEQEPLQWALEHDRSHYLISDLLALNDKAGMQWGLEMRMPYLDDALSAYAAGLPASYLLKNGKKWLLKQLLQKYDGKAYTRRAKEGFGMPFGAWIQAGKTEGLWQWLQQKEHPLHEVLDPAITRALLQAHRSGGADYSQELMALALLAFWMEKNF